MLIISPKVRRLIVLLFQFSTGVILAVFMFILFLVACLAFVMIAGAVSAAFLAAGMISKKKQTKKLMFPWTTRAIRLVLRLSGGPRS